MKATIKGIHVEGTPQEIAELMRLVKASDVPVEDARVPFRPDVTAIGTGPKPFVYEGKGTGAIPRL